MTEHTIEDKMFRPRSSFYERYCPTNRDTDTPHTGIDFDNLEIELQQKYDDITFLLKIQKKT